MITTTLKASLLAAALGIAMTAHAAEAPMPKELPPYGPERPLPVPQITQRTLPNGLTVWVIPRNGLPKVNVQLAVLGGTSYDDAKHPAQAELMAALFNEGTDTLSSKQIAEKLQAIGGDYGANAGRDSIGVSASALASHSDELLELVADTALHPSFPAKEVTLEKTNALQTLKVNQADPDWQSMRAFNHAVYGDHPYARDELTEASIQAVTPESLHQLHDQRMRPERALLVIVGKVDAGQVLKTVEQQFGSWKATGPAPANVTQVPTNTPAQKLLVARAGAVQTNIRFGQPTAPLRDPDFIPLTVANTVLGGGFSSRITQDIREDKGYSYSPYSTLDVRRNGGNTLAVVDVRNEVTGATLGELSKLYQGMGTEPASPEELMRAKRLIAGIYLLRNQIQSSLANTLARYWVSGMPPSFMTTYVTDTGKVTAEQVQAMGRKYFAPEKQSIILVGDPKAIDPQLKAIGSFTPYKP
ncbi:M16 family metallopeptidase [Dyella japonica]|uniref:Zinc protease n=1 Tax=Dyella japonica DSM 16301 TaxID=1440762 RepID=A0A0G9H2E1_9GAMM|nr:pitrilysin family protein [Dyella japonica]KLD63708.1 zinc protease [Dyella japonica DSM 16301]